MPTTTSPNALLEESKKLERRQGLIDARRHDLSRRDQADPDRMIELQARYDEAYKQLDLPGAPPPQPNESASTYRRRLCSDLVEYCSEATRKLNPFDLDSTAMNAIEEQVLKECREAAENREQGSWSGDPSELR